jgi:hypothetical protein
MFDAIIEIEQALIARSSDDARSGSRNHWRAGIWDESGGETFVAMMQASDLRDGDDLPLPCRRAARPLLPARATQPPSAKESDGELPQYCQPLRGQFFRSL